jgi:hypothetical protein
MNAPEKIYDWMNSQLSIARFYGGIDFNGYRYVIDMGDPAYPLVRKDLLKKESKKVERSEKDKALLAQLGLL